MRIIRDDVMNESSHLAALEVRYPDRSEWDIAAFEQLRDSELDAIRKEGENYDRETWFRQDAEYSALRVPPIRNRIPPIAQSVPLTY